MNFLATPIFKFLIAPLIGVAILTGGVFGVKKIVHNYNQGIRDEVHREYEVKDLKEALDQAEADKVFAQEQQEKSDKAAQELRQSLVQAMKRVDASRTIIHDKVASGELKNGVLSPTIEATINEVQIMENERAEK